MHYLLPNVVAVKSKIFLKSFFLFFLFEIKTIYIKKPRISIVNIESSKNRSKTAEFYGNFRPKRPKKITVKENIFAVLVNRQLVFNG